ncbi:MAG: hypothetical protein MJ071_09415 [Oscillospiraceae bacterium]|nr:hypothetical protein [Oscillospiraceae bacterium]
MVCSSASAYFFTSAFGLSIFPLTAVIAAIAGFAAFTVLPVMFCLERSIGTKLIIDMNTLTIQYFLNKRVIMMSDISYVNIEEYSRSRRRGRDRDYRVRMSIHLFYK